MDGQASSNIHSVKAGVLECKFCLGSRVDFNARSVYDATI